MGLVWYEFPVYRDTHDFYMELARNKSIESVPKDVRINIVEPLKKWVFDILVNIYRLYYDPLERRPAHIQDCLDLIPPIRVSLRMLCDMKLINPEQFIALSKQAESIQAQLKTMLGSAVGKIERKAERKS